MGPETDQERDDRSVCPGRLPEGLADALRATAEEIAQLLRRAPDTGAAVPGLVWTVGELAAHLAQANELMADVAAGRPRRHGDGTPEGIAAANEQALSIEPVTFLLMALGRCSPTGAMARGRVLAWGRRPWLGPRFPEYFTAP
ncbi:hypothetical protein QBW33_28165 [Streptomyces sp. B21-104]|uniref:hypothetical protein n=1 Tax=Streptomyces sp. B21-104 TaxID=3039421 RepID=UPI0030D2D017